MKNAERIGNGFEEIHCICEAQGRVVTKSLPYRLTLDSARKVSAVRSCKSPEAARLKARVLALEHEDWLESLGIEVHLHGFDETEEAANMARLDISNHPHGLEANSAYARYAEEIAGQVAIVLKNSLANLPFGIGKGVQALNPIIVDRPKIPRKGTPTRAQAQAMRAATKTTGEETRQRIIDGEKVMTFIEGTRENRNGTLLKFQNTLIAPSIDFIQKSPDIPSQLVVKTACLHGAFPHTYEQMTNPLSQTPVYQAPIHYFRDIIDIDARTTKDILAEAKKIMEENLITGIEKTKETISN